MKMIQRENDRGFHMLFTTNDGDFNCIPPDCTVVLGIVSNQ